MTRLDRHVTAVQNRLTLGRFLVGLGWALLVLAGVVWINILVDRLIGMRLPRWDLWLYGAAGVAVIAAALYATVTRPDRKSAAIAIDDRLGLKEKFSTALYVREERDPFAQAAVKDAEASAAGVDLRGKFPLAFPRVAYGALALALVAYLTSLLSPMDLLARETPQQKVVMVEQRQLTETKKAVKEAIAKAEQLPKAVVDDEKVAIAKRELEEVLNRPPTEPTKARLKAMEAAQAMQDAIKEAVKQNAKFAQAESDRKAFKSMAPPSDEKGPIADAHRAMASADFTEAIDQLSKAVENFDKMDKEQQEEAAKQMEQMSKQLQQMAQDPKVQQQLQQKLQQMGANEQQAKQMAQQMQQAANGDKQAQQQLQQMAQQLQQQMNNGQGPTPQQQQQMQQMMQQMQAMANTQAGAQAMAQAAQQMAQQMQQQAQQGQQQNPNQQGQQGQQQQQGMAQAQQHMQQQLQQMQAAAQDMQQIQAAQQAAQQGQEAAAGQAQGGGDGQQGQGEGNNQQVAQGEMEWKAGDPNNPGNGPGGVGVGAGDRSAKNVSPFGVKQELSPSQEDEKGKILASRYVKAGSLKGEMKQELTEVAQSAEREAPDEVEAERVSGQARKVLKDYFNAVQEDAR
jgi:hypothetical protein